MTETLTTTTADQTAAIGPGRLVLVVGPSGAGKDTLLGLAKAACADDGNIWFSTPCDYAGSVGVEGKTNRSASVRFRTR